MEVMVPTRSEGVHRWVDRTCRTHPILGEGEPLDDQR